MDSAVMFSDNVYANQRGMIGVLRKNIALRSASFHSQMAIHSFAAIHHNLGIGLLHAKSLHSNTITPNLQ
jgi:hypothetical protein